MAHSRILLQQRGERIHAYDSNLNRESETEDCSIPDRFNPSLRPVAKLPVASVTPDMLMLEGWFQKGQPYPQASWGQRPESTCQTPRDQCALQMCPPRCGWFLGTDPWHRTRCWRTGRMPPKPGGYQTWRWCICGLDALGEGRVQQGHGWPVRAAQSSSLWSQSDGCRSDVVNVCAHAYATAQHIRRPSHQPIKQPHLMNGEWVSARITLLLTCDAVRPTMNGNKGHMHDSIAYRHWTHCPAPLCD